MHGLGLLRLMPLYRFRLHSCVYEEQTAIAKSEPEDQVGLKATESLEMPGLQWDGCSKRPSEPVLSPGAPLGLLDAIISLAPCSRHRGAIDHHHGSCSLRDLPHRLHLLAPWLKPWLKPWHEDKAALRFVYAEILKPDLGGLFWPLKVVEWRCWAQGISS